MGRSRRPGSLATQISVSTLGLVSLTMLLAAVLALGGVYSMAQQETAARLQTFRDILRDDVTSRFQVTERVLDSVEAAVLATDDEQVVRDTLFRLAGSNTQYFDMILLADLAGDVMMVWPPSAAAEHIAEEPYFVAGLSGDTRTYTWMPADEADASGRVWITDRIEIQDGRADVVIAARIRIGFVVGLLVDEISSAEAGRVALVIDGDGKIVESGEGGPSLAADDLQWSPGGAALGEGVVRVEHPTLGMMDGYYADVAATEQLDWRVAVLEPRDVALDRTQDALFPASLTAAIAALVAMQVAFLFGRRLAAPLRILEDRAREVASGAYIQPIEVEREDEVGRLAEAFNAMATRLNAFQDLSQLLASASDLDQVLDGILSATEHILGTERSAVLLLDDDGHSLDLVKTSGTREHRPDLSVPVSGHGWVSQAFRTGKTVSFILGSGEPTDDPVLAMFGTKTVSSGLIVPLSIGHQPFGVVLVVSPGRKQFTDAETEMARAFAAQASVAVQNSRLFEEERLSRAEAEALREMAELLAGPKGLKETLEDVGSIAANLLGMSGSHLAMTEQDRRFLEVGHAEDPWADQRYLEIWDDQTRPAVARESSDPVLVTSLAEHSEYSDLARERDVQAVIMIPMMQGGARRGVLVLECRDYGRSFSTRDISVAHATGKTVSVALETNYLFHQARRRAENLEMVFRISQAVGLSLQTTVVLNRVMDVVQKMIPSTGVSLMQHDSRRNVLTTAMVRGIEDKRVLLAEVGAEEDIPGQAFTSRSPVIVHDIERIDTATSRLLRSQGFRSWLCTPLLARGRSIGVLSVYAKEAGAFSDEEAELISTFAAQAALALDTAELFEKEHTIASVLQSSIVPKGFAQIDGLDTSSAYQPAGSESEIGGDYYDLFEARDGRLVLAIGDVCGKGVQAATKTSKIKYTLRGLVTAGLGPSAVLRELNRVVAEMGDVADIVTMWVGYLDRATGRLIYANAGHPPALIRAPDGSITGLEPTGPLLGAMDEPKYTKRALTLEPGSVVLLYTDGVTEARGSEGLFGEERLRGLVADGGTAEAVVERVTTAVRQYTGGVLRDDVAILAVRYLSPEHPS